jgi:hypothetical protein
MKLIREHINEKFTEESDPVKDLNIGLSHQIREWLVYYVKLRMMPNHVYMDMFTINDDLTINVDGDLDISYDFMRTLPSYIKFNRVNGKFACCFNDHKVVKINGPKIVEGDYDVYYHLPKLLLSEKFIRKYCDVKGDVLFSKV